MASFGIASIIISVLAIFIPVFGVMLSGLSGVMAWLSAGRGSTLGAAAVIINVLNLFFLSPGYMIVAGIEASARDYEEHKLVVIWMIVLFIQIAAVVVFLINMFMGKLPSISIKTKRPKQAQQPSAHNLQKQSNSNPVNSISIDPEENVSKVTKILIHKVHGGRKKDSKFWNDDIDLSKKVKNNNEIAIDSIKPKKKKELQQPWMILPAVVLITLVVLIIARHDLFPFLDYHNVYKAVAGVDGTQVAQRRPSLADYKPVSPITPFNSGQKSTHKKSSYSFRKEPSKESLNHSYTGNDISLSGMVFSWRDEGGQRHFSNTNYPVNNPTLQVQTELNTYRKITKVHVKGNQIYVPVTLKNKGLSTTTWMLLDTGCSHTNVPYSKLNKIKAKYGKTVYSTIADGSTKTGREAYIDMMQVGSQKERNVRVTGSKVAGSSNSGLLGLDFLKRRPFKIDYDRQMLVWM